MSAAESSHGRDAWGTRQNALTQVVGDLVELCRALKPHVLDIIENVTDEGCLNLALTVHDELTRVLQGYDKILAEQSRLPPAPAGAREAPPRVFRSKVTAGGTSAG